MEHSSINVFLRFFNSEETFKIKSYVFMIFYASLLYWNGLEADFSYDDSRAILDNQDLLPETPWYLLFFDDFWGTPIQSSNSHGSYRPLAVISFRINYLIHGFEPFGFHFGNLLLHLAVVLTYMRFVELVLNHRRRVTLIASLLFASHPIHVESVTSIVGRADLGAGFFYLLSIIFYMKFVKSNKQQYLISSLGLAAMAMLTKEHGVTCLLICVIYHLFIVHKFFLFSRKSYLKVIFEKKFSLLRKGLSYVFIALIVLFLFRFSLMKSRPSFAPADNPASDNHSVMIRFLTFHYLPIFNFWLLVYPKWLSFDWSMEAIPLISSLWDPRNLLTIIFYISLLKIFRQTCHYYSKTFEHSINKFEQTENQNSSFSQNSKYNQNSNSIEFQLNSDCLYDENNNNASAVNLNCYPINEGYNLFYNASNENENLLDHNHNLIFPQTNQTILKNNTSSKFQKRKKRLSKLKTYSAEDFVLNRIDCLVFSVALTIVPFLPATNLFFYVGFVVAERILYIPSFGFCLFVAVCIEFFYQYCKKHIFFKWIIYFFLALLFLTYSARTVLRNIDWLTEENLYRAGISINPPKAYGNLGNVLSLKGKNQEAEEAYRKALTYRFNMADVHYNLGLLLQKQKRYDEALESYRKAIQFRPRLAMSYLNMGTVLSQLKKREESKQVYEKCSTLDGTGLKDIKNHQATKVSCFYNLGRLYLEEGNYHMALNICLKALNIMPPYYQQAQSIFNVIGEIHFKMNQTKEAEMWFNKSLKKKRDHLPAHLTFAKMLIQLNRTVEAEKLYQKALTFNPNDVIVYHHYGQLAFNLGRFEKALTLYEKALKLDPENSDIILQLANILRELKRNIEAEKFYFRASELRPNDFLTHSNLGAIYHLNQKFKLAQKSYLQALKLKPDDQISKTNLIKLNQVFSTKYNYSNEPSKTS